MHARITLAWDAGRYMSGYSGSTVAVKLCVFEIWVFPAVITQPSMLMNQSAPDEALPDIGSWGLIVSSTVFHTSFDASYAEESG